MNNLILLFTSLNFFLLIATCSSVSSIKTPTIIQQVFDIDPNARKYVYGFETSNQIYVEEQGYVKDDDSIVKEGQYQYTSPNGEIIRVIYTADENGFHPQGSHLPTAPPVPSASYSFSIM